MWREEDGPRVQSNGERRRVGERIKTVNEARERATK